jgi:hypothetical protein
MTMPLKPSSPNPGSQMLCRFYSLHVPETELLQILNENLPCLDHRFPQVR